MALASLIVSVLALIVAGGGTYLANKRATEALRDARDTRLQGVWSDAIAAAQRMMIDPTSQPLRDEFQDLRIRFTALSDALPEWEGLDRWLAAELSLGATISRRAIEGYSSPAVTPDERFERMKPVIDWVIVLSNNLRLLRKDGYNAEVLSRLQKHARDVAIAIHRRHGWEVPPSESDGISPLN